MKDRLSQKGAWHLHGSPDKVFIIAEAGVNHNGSLQIAKQLVSQAAAAGADAVKFQTFSAKNIVVAETEKASYQKAVTESAESQLDMLTKLELGRQEHHELFGYCRNKNILFLSTPFDLPSIDFLDQLGMQTFKIPSGEITNLPHIRKVSKRCKKVIVSTGMAYMDEVKTAVNILLSNGVHKKNIALLHCTTAYPCPMQDVNLLAMRTLKDSFPGITVGYSDHTTGIEIPIAAAALGAEIIEKHFTLDKGMIGPDHSSSLNPVELKAMIAAIRNIEIAMGDGNKKPSESEIENIPYVRKSIVAAREIHCGETFTKKNLTTKRPARGLSPMHWDELINKKAGKNYQKDDLIER